MTTEGGDSGGYAKPTLRGDHHPEKEKAQQTLGFRRAGEGT
jgi:hypothetical protein